MINGYSNIGTQVWQAQTASQGPANEPRSTPFARSEPVTQPTREQVAVALNQVQGVVQTIASDLKFSVDKETGETIIRITDVKTGEMIRQIPSVELVEIAKSLDKMQGLLFKQRA